MPICLKRHFSAAYLNNMFHVNLFFRFNSLCSFNITDFREIIQVCLFIDKKSNIIFPLVSGSYTIISNISKEKEKIIIKGNPFISGSVCLATKMKVVTLITSLLTYLLKSRRVFVKKIYTSKIVLRRLIN